MSAQPNELPDDMARALRALDADATRRAERVDADVVASRVLARLREAVEPAPVPRVLPGRWALSRVPVWMRATAAAALIVVFAGSLVLGVFLSGGDRARAVPVAAVGMDSLNTTQLEALLRVTADVRPVATAREQRSGSWEDLSELELEAVLQAVQQVQGEAL